MRFADWIEQSGMTRSEVAQKLGVVPSYVTELCQGKKWPGRGMAMAIRSLTHGQVTASDFESAA